MDIVPCHTSIEHPWFREHPDWYIWADAPNNWSSAFGGSAWSPLNGRYYLHSFYPEQPDLDWRNPEVIAAMQEVLRFWLDRGIAGYRVDAIDRLLKDPQLRDDPPATEAFGLPLREDEAKLALIHSRNAPDTGEALAKIREAVGDAYLVGEVYLPSTKWQPYLDHFDAAFAFELLHAPWRADALRHAIAATTQGPGAAWVMSNHDFGRLATRFGHENARAAALLTADAARPRLPVPGRRDRPGRGPARREALRPRRPRPFSPPDAVGRHCERRLHRRGSVAAGGGPEDHQRRRPARGSRLDAEPRTRPNPRRAGISTGKSSCSTRPTGCSPTGAASTRSRSTRPRSLGRRRRSATRSSRLEPGAVRDGDARRPMRGCWRRARILDFPRQRGQSQVLELVPPGLVSAPPPARSRPSHARSVSSA